MSPPSLSGIADAPHERDATITRTTPTTPLAPEPRLRVCGRADNWRDYRLPRTLSVRWRTQRGWPSGLRGSGGRAVRRDSKWERTRQMVRPWTDGWTAPTSQKKKKSRQGEIRRACKSQGSPRFGLSGRGETPAVIVSERSAQGARTCRTQSDRASTPAV